jgi:hypothetical protein
VVLGEVWCCALRRDELDSRVGTCSSASFLVVLVEFVNDIPRFGEGLLGLSSLSSCSSLPVRCCQDIDSPCDLFWK